MGQSPDSPLRCDVSCRHDIVPFITASHSLCLCSFAGCHRHKRQIIERTGVCNYATAVGACVALVCHGVVMAIAVCLPLLQGHMCVPRGELLDASTDLLTSSLDVSPSSEEIEAFADL